MPEQHFCDMRVSLLLSVLLVGFVSLLLNIVSEIPIGDASRDRLSSRFATTLGDPRYDWREVVAPSASGE